MILEGIVTTKNLDGSPNISPMGPRVEANMARFVLRPYRTSQTYQNLRRTPQGVFHVTDDVELLAHAAVNQLTTVPELIPATGIDGFILADACRWYAFQVARLDDHEERTTIECVVVDRGTQREFFGFNRAKHAVLEAAILATRLHLLPPQQITDDFGRLAILVEKTAGPQERRAFEFLVNFVRTRLEQGSSEADPQLTE